jgi:small subunit ribosomal protein S8
MVTSDPIADMLTRIRNGGRARLQQVSIPESRIKRELARVLKETGFIRDYRSEQREGKPVLMVELRYRGGTVPMIQAIERVSKPSRRRYVRAKQVPAVRNGLGVAILSTPRGILTDAQAREARVGGEYLARVW